MGNAKHIDGGALAVALEGFRRAATRMAASIRDTALVVTALLWQSGVRRPRWSRRPSSADDAGPLPSVTKRELKIATK
jgi:hypothetical protein